MERVFHLNLDDVLRLVRAALESGDQTQAVALIQALRPADQADVFSELADQEQASLLPNLAPEDSADILEELEDEEAVELAEALSDADLARIVNEMEPDEAADLLGDLPDARAEAILNSMEDSEEVRPLLMHADESAGGLMTTDFLVLRPRMRVSEALMAIRQLAPKDSAETLYNLYVVDTAGILRGVVSLYQLLQADPAARVGDVMEADVLSARADEDREVAAGLMTRYDLLSLPVVDSTNRLLGIITHDDFVDIVEEETTEDIQMMGGSAPLDGPYLDIPVVRVARKRVGWLMLLFITGTLTGTVMRWFADDLEAVVALAFFIPLLIGTGGNAGSQTTATIIRSIAVGDVRWRDGLAVLWHELRIGILLGAAMALFGFVRAILWGTGYDVGFAVAASLLVVVTWAVTVGSLLPLLATKLRFDPAMVSGPLMSTLVDATGLLIYLSVAKLMLSL
ncbi:MAG: magnesium transporter [Chloroflexi bacterium HGW-Chloroflexi-1]|nr:MAG: magnesium transporter [Chloroflexi bacterium HGW-Chloroflexi-1]